MIIPKQLYPYLDKPPEQYGVTAVELFTAYTTYGKKIPLFLEDRETNLELADLMFAHSVSSREPSGILEGLWIEGGVIPTCTDYLLDIFRDAERFGESLRMRWLRKLPLYLRLHKLHCGLPRQLWTKEWQEQIQGLDNDRYARWKKTLTDR